LTAKGAKSLAKVATKTKTLHSTIVMRRPMSEFDGTDQPGR
jgi:hypothetical protein